MHLHKHSAESVKARKIAWLGLGKKSGLEKTMRYLVMEVTLRQILVQHTTLTVVFCKKCLSPPIRL